MEITLRSLEPNLIYLICRGVISQPLSENPDDPLRVIGDWRGKVLLNLGQTEYIDSSGIAWLVKWHRRIKMAGGVLALCSVPPRVEQVLHLCQLHQVLSIWENEKAARVGLAVSPLPASDSSSPQSSPDSAADAP